VNWREARDLLDGKGKKRGPRDSLKIARNTYLERGAAFQPAGKRGVNYSGLYSLAYHSAGKDYPDNAIGLRLHGTYVAILTPHWTELYTGGWATMTTRDRMSYVANIMTARPGWAVALRVEKVQCPRCYGSSAPPYEGSPFCYACSGTGIYSGTDWENSHPYFDGIRISADGKRLMREQPHKPKAYRPIKTHSGW
jgi:hypothetical protein